MIPPEGTGSPAGGPSGHRGRGGAVGTAPPGAPGNGQGPPRPGNGATPPTGGNGHGPTPPDDPFAPPPPKPWYRRSTAVAGAVLLAVAAIAVVADLPTHATQRDHVSTITAEINAINKDIRPCSYAVKQAFSIYRHDVRGQMTAHQTSQAEGLLRDDQNTCTFTNQSVINLGTITLPQTSAGLQLSGVVKSVLVWETSDGAGAIDDVQTLLANPTDAKAVADLRKRERLLASDRAESRTATAAVDKALGGAHVPPPVLPQLPTNFPPT